MIRRAINLPYATALHRMFRGSLLLRSNGRRIDYEVSPGGPVSDDTARRIIEHSLCRPVDAGLLPDQPQSWEFDIPISGFPS